MKGNKVISREKIIERMEGVLYRKDGPDEST
jgi:hypothetical protein